jgi:hypothetical protein
MAEAAQPRDRRPTLPIRQDHRGSHRQHPHQARSAARTRRPSAGPGRPLRPTSSNCADPPLACRTSEFGGASAVAEPVSGA